MAKVSPYHTTAKEHPPAQREVYHDHDDCPDGKKILPRHRVPGTRSKKHCGECDKLG